MYDSPISKGVDEVPKIAGQKRPTFEKVYEHPIYPFVKFAGTYKQVFETKWYTPHSLPLLALQANLYKIDIKNWLCGGVVNSLNSDKQHIFVIL